MYGITQTSILSVVVHEINQAWSSFPYIMIIRNTRRQYEDHNIPHNKARRAAVSMMAMGCIVA